MRLSPHCIALLLLAGLFAGTAAQGESVDADSAQRDASASLAAAEPPRRTSKPLARYPGAPYEDRNGNLWFSTVLEGLLRYDGTTFVTLTVADGLASDSVRDILEDDAGVLWIATTGGSRRTRASRSGPLRTTAISPSRAPSRRRAITVTSGT